MQIHGDQYKALWEQAESDHSFKCLVPYRNILTYWMRRHPEDILRIAAIGSHRLGHHMFCTADGTRHGPIDQTKCDTIDRFIKECEFSLLKTGQTSLTVA